jgi:hypothetical protein
METIVACVRYPGNEWTRTEYLGKENQPVIDSRASWIPVVKKKLTDKDKKLNLKGQKEPQTPWFSIFKWI